MSAHRPNFLLLMTDQQRGDALGIEGHPVLLTPTLDAIAHQGVRFRRAYSTCPVCIPARRSLLSGQFPKTHGMLGYREGVDWEPEATLPGVLSAAGYQTYLAGRGMHQHPPRKRFGYAHMVVHQGRESDYDEWLARRQPEGSGGYYGTGVTHNDWTARAWHLPEAYHMTNWTVNTALDFLRKRDPSCPFVLTVSFLAPHPPLVPPAPYMERYLRLDLPAPAIGDWAEPPADGGLGLGPAPGRVDLRGEALRAARAGYYGLINHVDDQLNRLLSPLLGLDGATARNTVVLFCSDHGEMLGDHYLWRKSLPYEASARVPFLVRAPAHMGLSSGATVDAPVCLEDLMPTVLDLAGLDVPPSVEGRSLVPWLKGETPAWREHLHLECAPTHHALTDGRWKYVWWVADGREQFFDLAADPQECRDLARVEAAAPEVGRWRARMVAELAERPEGCSDGQRLIAGRPYPAVRA